MLFSSFLLFAASLLAADVPADIPQCRNHAGEPVDWWLIMKEAGGSRYVYYDSVRARAAQDAGARHQFDVMQDARKLDDSLTSPILHTIYAGLDVGVDVHERSGTVFVAVNDQPAQKEGNLERDAFKAPVSDISGHVKFMAAARVVYAAERPALGDAKVYSYLLQHSLPRFPNVSLTAGPSTHDAIFANKLPANRASVFSSNLDKKGQHFFCMSFEDRQQLDREPETATGVYKHQLRYRPVEMAQYLTSGQHHFVSILHSLKVVHASPVATNYDPHSLAHSVFHQLLNTYAKWSEARARPDQLREQNLNLVRTSLPADGRNYDSPHLCPMFPVARRVKVGLGGRMEKLHTYQREKHCMRSGNAGGTGVCRNGAVGDMLCLASAPMRSTARQYELQSLLLMKGRTVQLGLYDDLIAPMALNGGRVEAQVEGLSLLVQTWIDNATLPANEKPQGAGQPLLHIQNCTSTSMPGPNDTFKPIPSLGTDHSKWALLLPHPASVGSLPALFCLADLNRTHRQEARGGGASCLRDPLFTELMLGLRPQVADGFLDKNVPYDRLQHLFAHDQEERRQVAVAYECTDGDAGRCKAFFLGTPRGDGRMAIFRHTSPHSTGTLEIAPLYEGVAPIGDIAIEEDGPLRVANGLLHLPMPPAQPEDDLAALLYELLG